MTRIPLIGSKGIHRKNAKPLIAGDALSKPIEATLVLKVRLMSIDI